jgi:hypothetical protein
MHPFDPTWEFEQLVVNLNKSYAPGSLVSGRARNALIEAWALYVGRGRAQRELAEAVKRHGSRNRLLSVLHISRSSLAYFERFLETIPDRDPLPASAAALRSAYDALSGRDQTSFVRVAVELLKDPSVLARLAETDTGQVGILLGGALRAYDLTLAVKQLEDLLDDGVSDESRYQDWCEQHSWAFGNAHVLRDDVRRLDSASIVDILLPDLVGYRDIVELKRPDHVVLAWDRSHKAHYFSADTSRALGQVHKYLDRLQELAREGLAGAPDVVAYHPHATIVIGRSRAWPKEQVRALRGLNDRLHGVTVVTYDHLLAQARQTLATLG